MRSYDYCHFEVSLSMVESGNPTFTAITTQDVDKLRKEAARLADKAVAQYKVAKAEALKLPKLMNDEWKISQIREKSDTERTPEEKARLKAYEDAVHRASHSEYDYDDDWDSHEDDWEDHIIEEPYSNHGSG